MRLLTANQANVAIRCNYAWEQQYTGTRDANEVQPYPNVSRARTMARMLQCIGSDITPAQVSYGCLSPTQRLSPSLATWRQFAERWSVPPAPAMCRFWYPPGIEQRSNESLRPFRPFLPSLPDLFAHAVPSGQSGRLLVCHLVALLRPRARDRPQYTALRPRSEQHRQFDIDTEASLQALAPVRSDLEQPLSLGEGARDSVVRVSGVGRGLRDARGRALCSTVTDCFRNGRNEARENTRNEVIKLV